MRDTILSYLISLRHHRQRREDKTWKIIGAFVIVCALLTALIIVLG
jgi:NADPH-dependent 7-cyano-7-deazaguanine reductase QueF